MYMFYSSLMVFRGHIFKSSSVYKLVANINDPHILLDCTVIRKLSFISFIWLALTWSVQNKLYACTNNCSLLKKLRWVLLAWNLIETCLVYKVFLVKHNILIATWLGLVWFTKSSLLNIIYWLRLEWDLFGLQSLPC